mgnify:FL=1
MTKPDFRPSSELPDFPSEVAEQQRLPEPKPGEINPYNGLTRADTFGIRPDLFFELAETIPQVPTVEKLIKQARESLAQSEASLREADKAREEARKALEESGVALKDAAVARTQARVAVDKSTAAIADSTVAVGQALSLIHI